MTANSAQPDPDGESFRLREAECPPREALQARAEGRERARLPLAEHEREIIAAPRRWPRFSLVELLLAVTLTCIGLALSTWLPPAAFAGLAGLAAVAGLVVVIFRPPQSRPMKIAWTSMIAIYVIAAALAVVKSRM